MRTVDVVVRGVRVVVGVLVLAALVAVVLVFRSTDVADLQAAVRGAGLWAPVLFVFLQVVVTTAPVPRTVFTLASGVLFGSVVGVAVAVAATITAAVGAFLLVRWVGAALPVRWVEHSAMRWLRDRLDRSGVLAVASLRLIAPLPFAVVNYAAGLSGVRLRAYALGTSLGVLPGTVALVVLGDAVTGRPSPLLLAISATCVTIGLVGAAVASRRPSAVGHEPASASR